jgi:hypothetical protein
MTYFAEFNWHKYALTVHGPVNAVDLSELASEDKPISANFFPSDLLDMYQQRYLESEQSCINNLRVTSRGNNSSNSEDPQDADSVDENWAMKMAFADAKIFYRRGLVNVMNPIAPKSSLTRSVDALGYEVIRSTFKRGLAALKSMCCNFSQNYDFNTSSNVTLGQCLVQRQKSVTQTMGDTSSLEVICEYFQNTCDVILPVITGIVKGGSRNAVSISRNVAVSIDPLKSMLQEIEV